MNFDWLYILAKPWFVIPWYAVGFVAAVWVLYDEYRVNTAVNPALKWAWPIIMLFFSLIGLALYFWTCRPARIGEYEDEGKKQEVHHEHATSTFRKVTGSVIHCVGGDGLGIMTAMVAARLLGMSFWQEFWFEYIVGFAFGWFIFQYKAMRSMAHPLGAIWMGGRAEFFSMITVMAGMGMIMGYVTPLVVGEQPQPDTLAFWGFGALGLMAGFVVTYPMNWMLVKIEWKQGMS